MSIQNLPPLRHAPQRVRPPFNVTEDPLSAREPSNDHVAALLEALDGIELGAHDRRIIEWLAEWEIGTVGTVVSLLYRARAAGTWTLGGHR